MVAADISAGKLSKLVEAGRRLGLPAIETVAADLTAAGPDTLAGREFDAVVVDAPCSGLGVLRRHPETRWRERSDGGELLALQSSLLDRTANLVGPGGQLIYAVCTFDAREGRGQIEQFLARRPDFAPAPLPEDPAVDWGPLRAAEPAIGQLETWPHRCGGDAFFACRMTRS